MATACSQATFRLSFFFANRFPTNASTPAATSPFQPYLSLPFFAAFRTTLLPNIREPTRGHHEYVEAKQFGADAVLFG